MPLGLRFVQRNRRVVRLRQRPREPVRKLAVMSNMSRLCSWLIAPWALLVACAAPAPMTRDSPPTPRVVRTAAAAEGTWSRGLLYTGTVVAERDILVGTAVSGRVVRMEAQRGDAVEAGAPLVRLDDREARAAAEGAAASLAQARARLGGAQVLEETPEVKASRAAWQIAVDARERGEALARHGSVSEQELLRLRAAEQGARAQLDGARAGAQAVLGQLRQGQAAVRQNEAALGHFVVSAPFSGVVQERLAQEGEVVSAGSPVLRLLDPSSRKLRFEVPQHEAGRIEAGGEVRIEGGKGKIRRVAPGLAGEGRTLQVEAQTEEPLPPTMLPGARVEVRVLLAEQESCVVIPGAALRKGSAARAWVVRGGKVEERLVEVLAEERGRTLVRRGLSAGEVVVLDPPTDLRDGQEVQP